MPKKSSQGEAEKYWKQALMAEEQKNLPKAIRLIEKALELNPDWDEAKKILRSAESKLHPEL